MTDVLVGICVGCLMLIGMFRIFRYVRENKDFRSAQRGHFDRFKTRYEKNAQ